MTVIATVQVRMGSSRLPGKALRTMGDRPMLAVLLDRLALCKQLDGVVVATSERPENDAIEAFCRARGTSCFRGDEDDVLGRMMGALRNCDATVGVEIFGDCPLIDPAIVDMMIARFHAADPACDFIGNDLQTTYPPGMEVEVFTVAALADSAIRCTDPAIREHGTLFIRQHPDLYRLLSVEATGNQRRPELELEVDTIEDFTVLEQILLHFQGRPDFSLDDIIAFADAHPELMERNAAVPRRWKQFRNDSPALHPVTRNTDNV